MEELVTILDSALSSKINLSFEGLWSSVEENYQTKRIKKIKELTKQVRDWAVEKYKAGLVYKKNIPGFEHLTEHYEIHHLKMGRVWHSFKSTKTRPSI